MEKPQIADIWEFNGPEGFEHYLFLEFIKRADSDSSDEYWVAIKLDTGVKLKTYWWSEAWRKLA